MKWLWKKDRSGAQQTEQIEISEDRVKLRAVLFVITLLIAVGAFAYGMGSLFSSEPGMQEITVLSTGKLNCGGEFTFYYYLGAGGVSATSEQKSVRALYSQAAIDAYQLFNADMEFEGCNNLWYINEHVNEEISVDPILYEALSLLETIGARYHYLAPIYPLYLSLFQCGYDQETLAYDPFINPDLRTFYSRTAQFANNPGDVAIELLGSNTVRLMISDDYLHFAQENGITRFIDLFWLKNAFTADYIAGILRENGYTRGTLISHDGFVRHLDDTPGAEFTFTLSRREGTTVSAWDTLRFSAPVSIVYLRDYPLGTMDEDSYYVREDGAIRFPYIDTADGLCKSAIPDLAASSAELGCAEIALKIAPIYIADTLDETALQTLAQEGISVYYQP